MIPRFDARMVEQVKEPLIEAFKASSLSKKKIYTACIYYAAVDLRPARYLKEVLSLILKNICFEERSGIHPVKELNNIDLYFALIPEKFDDLYTGSFNLKDDLDFIIRRNPSCCIFFVHCHESTKRNSSILAEDISRKTSQKVRDIYICPSLREFLIFKVALSKIINSGETPMAKELKATNSITDIMTSSDSLITADLNSKFSEVFYKVNGLGVSHIPILKSPIDEKCIKILSRRDLVKRIPPSRIPEEVATRYGINRGKLVRMIAELGNKTMQELFPSEQNIIFGTPSTSILEAINILSTKHLIGDYDRYISGVPVYVSEDTAELEGFVSFRDILKKFISTQPKEFLSLKVQDVATLPSDYEEIIRMTDSDNLSYADSLFQTGIRSLPIVKGDYDSNELWGFVDEIKVNVYNHEAFTNQLATLECKYFATPREALRIVNPNETLESCLPDFWKRGEGASPPASFVVGEETKKNDGTAYIKLRGILSYIDILKAWKKWNSKR
jgi:CBS domain-containing protein